MITREWPLIPVYGTTVLFFAFDRALLGSLESTLWTALMLAWLWAYRMTHHRVASVLTSIMFIFAGGARWLLLLLPQPILQLISNQITPIGSAAVTAPDLLAGDLTVSARSAALGLPLQPGHTYTYLVYYRDPVVLGGCPATSTYNATQTGSMTWWP